MTVSVLTMVAPGFLANATPGKVSKGDSSIRRGSPGRLNYSTSVQTGGYVLRLACDETFTLRDC